ncbi:MAG: rubredoxin-like domain-containing protein [Candidatus Aenigmatarchaeota archaeon]
MYEACRCEVCGEVYLGTEKPETCPFCGAHKLHLESMDLDEFKALIPDDFEGGEEEMNLFIDLDEEEFPEVSEEIMEKVKKSARDYGILEAYSMFSESVSQEAAEKFFESLGELEIKG